jgi:hypothetical protein
VKLVDDIDGSEASQTVAFALEGRSYEIDLSEKNAARLRDALSDYVKAGRRSGGRASNGARSPRTTATKREETTAIRQWARDNGHKISDRGRIPSNVLQAYEDRK